MSPERNSSITGYLKMASKFAETLRRMKCILISTIGALNVGLDEDN
jgi:hypothetical protein